MNSKKLSRDFTKKCRNRSKINFFLKLKYFFLYFSAEHDEEKLNNLLDHLLGSGIVSDGTVANSPSHQQQLWPLRERIAEALLRDGYCYKYDISLPYESFYQR